MRLRAGLTAAFFSMLIGAACAHTVSRNAVPSTAPPSWVEGEALQGDHLCGLGVAGAGFNADSPYPKQLSQERAVLNLAGILATQKQDAIIDDQTSEGDDVETAQVLKVDEALVHRVAAAAKTEFWLDVDGTGPYAQKAFTYAHSCMDAADLQGALKIDAKQFKDPMGLSQVSPTRVPGWLHLTGTQPGGRLCATGFSLPTFFADNTFGSVVDDVRSQLAENLQSLVSSYYHEVSAGQSDVAEQMTVATNDSLAKGVIVTHYWYDRDGIGPNKQKLSTYGWGCVYPVDVMLSALAAAEEKLPEQEKAKVAAVKERAAAAFADLDAESTHRVHEPVANSHGPGVAQDATAP